MSVQDVLKDLPISEEDWNQTPSAVRALVLQQHELIAKLIKRVEELEARLGQNSQIRDLPTYSILVEALTCSFQNEAPDVSWI